VTLLLDTNVVLWWLDDPGLLSDGARTTIREGKNAVYVSAAVAWEIVIKKSLGKLDVPDNLEEVLAANRFQPLPILIPHTLKVLSPPLHHRDPFDRLLIAQTLLEGGRLLTRDPDIARYAVPLLLA
jgi:PIN domain nuclease of toxin-antitoxin system